MHCLCVEKKQIYSLNCCYRISLTITSIADKTLHPNIMAQLMSWPKFLSGKNSKTVNHLFNYPLLVSLALVLITSIHFSY